MTAAVKGRGAIRTAAVLLTASAVFEILDAGAPVALFGALRGGPAAFLYHLVLAGLFLFCGIGLWRATPWGYWAVMAATAVYTIDKLQLMLFPQAFYDSILGQLTVTREIVEMIPPEQLLKYFILAYAALVLCWWGFAGYIHLRRSYFRRPENPDGR
jgi:hypothetical protein